MRVALVARDVRTGSGTAGYARRLLDAWVDAGVEVELLRPGAPRVDVATLALEPVPGATLWRTGGGWHTDAMRATRRRPSMRRWQAERVAARTAGAVVANSWLVHAGLARRRIRSTVVRTGAPVDRFQPGPDEGFVLFAAHGWHRKGFRTAVLAVERGLPGRELWVAGRDARRTGWLRWANRHVRIRDLGPTVDLTALLPRASAVVHPTLYDPASNLVLEALAAGVPVVTSAMDGSAEVLPVACVVRSARDVDHVARRLAHLVERRADLQPELRARAEAWPDSRSASAMLDLLWRTHHGR